jgi:hypothetical protein
MRSNRTVIPAGAMRKISDAGCAPSSLLGEVDEVISPD